MGRRLVTEAFEIFLSVQPGLEKTLAEEASEAGFGPLRQQTGGVAFDGTWEDVWRANLTLRGATRVLARIGSFRAFHLAQLDKRSRKFPWDKVLRPDVPLKIEVTSRKSKIYHAGAAKQRIGRAISETIGAPICDDAALRLLARIDDNLVTFSVDTSGEPLHKRGLKQAVNKAPMRETLAASFLRLCGYKGREPVLDPMCGSGTFLIEAAEISANNIAGRARDFAFEKLVNFDAHNCDTYRDKPTTKAVPQFFGFDRDQGAIQMAQGNAERAAHDINLYCQPITDLKRPEGPPGLVIVNPPYGARIGNRKLLFGLYAALGKALIQEMKGWRVGLITSDAGLARETHLNFTQISPPVDHGGTKIKLYQTEQL